MTDIKKGDRVKVTIEGEVVYTATRSVEVRTAGGSIVEAYAPNAPIANLATIEKIEPPVEVFKPGDTVRDKRLPAFTFLVLHGGYVDLHNKVHHPRSTIFTSEKYEKVE